MPIFKIEEKNNVRKLKIKKFKNEKELQKLFENNLEEIFGIRFLASEFTTSYRGRIDTLGLDEDGSPVIIEYKRDEKDNVINQGLFYLDWLVDHRGDFEILVQKKLGRDAKITWDVPRLILVAQSFNQYDKYAVKRISENIELKKYVLYENNILFVENVLLPNEKVKPKKKKKTDIVYKEYTMETHLKGKTDKIKELFKELQEKILELDDKVTEKILKYYFAYELNRNFAEVVVQSKNLKIYLDINKKDLEDPKKIVKDCTQVGHMATGDCVFKISAPEDIEYAISLIKQSYESKI